MRNKILGVKNSKASSIFHKKRFETISEERRWKIFDVAVSEFALNGYSATNINTIALKAEISIGSMYNYFESKEALFLTIIQKGVNDLERVLKEIQLGRDNIFVILESLFRAARDYSKQYPEMNQIYLDATSQGLSGMSAKLSRQIEEITYELYINILQKAKDSGTIDKGVDIQLAAFFIDNLVVMLQFSLATDYYKERMKIFLGPEALNEDERIIQGMVGLFKKAYLN